MSWKPTHRRSPRILEWGLWNLILGAAILGADRVHACNECGCADLPDDQEICEPHVHPSGGLHDHVHAPPASGTSRKPLAEDVRPPALGTSGPLRFAVIADTQGLSVLDQLIADVNTHNVDRMIIPGDLVGTGGNGSWNNWISKAQNFNGGLANIYMTPGNHDQPSGTDALWRTKFSQTPGGQPWLPDSQNINGFTGFDQMDYYVDIGSTRVISITTDTSTVGASQLAPQSLNWMSQALQDAEGNNAIDDVFVFTHHPVTFDSLGQGGSANRTGTSADMWQSLVSDSTKVRSLFAGHWHLYQPSQPDPNHPDTWEIVLGTGGGGLEGRAVQNRHGFTLIDVYDDGRIEGTFYGDSNDGTDGFQFNDILDRFTIADPNPTPSGLVAYYSFNFGNGNLDTAPGALAKQNHGGFNGNATTVSGGILGKALALDGNADFADGASLGDYNLAINRDLTVSVHANFDSLAAGPDENTLVLYGAATGHPLVESEAVNVAYSLRIRDDKRLEATWERDDGTDAVFTSSSVANVDPGEWHHYVMSRDTTTGQLVFYVDGVQLGNAISYGNLPTGGGGGFLHVGAALNASGGFDGLIDELTIYNDAILPGEVFVGPTPGDLDGDLDVDIDDFVINFLPNFGETLAETGSAATLAMGDLDFDGDVDFFDFDAFQGAYLEANPGAAPLSLRIPEPTAWVLALLAGMVILGRLRRFSVTAVAMGTAISMGVATPTIAASVIHDYQFNADLNDSNPAAGSPALASGGGILRNNGYSFSNGQGLSLSSWDPSGLGEDYSIEIYAQFDSFGNGSYGKLVDFKDRSSDTGFYIRNINGGQRPIFFNVNQDSPGSGSLNNAAFHHIVIARDEPGQDDVNVWLDGVQQWTFDDGSSELAVANAANNVLHFFSDDGGSENPTGYVDFIRIYDDAVSQAEVDAMTSGLPQYGNPEVVVNKIDGEITLNSNNGVEPLDLRGYQLTSPSGQLSVANWTSWAGAGLDGDTWYEANPSSTQLAELNLTSSGLISSTGSRSFGDVYVGGVGGTEDLVFEYLEPNNSNAIAIPVTYVGTPVFVIGDLDFDNDIDGDDWLLYADGLGKNFTGMTMFDAFRMGDMDDDLDNDYNDFLLFENAFDQANGLGALASMLAVPEPDAGAYAAIIVLHYFAGFALRGKKPTQVGSSKSGTANRGSASTPWFPANVAADRT